MVLMSEKLTAVGATIIWETIWLFPLVIINKKFNFGKLSNDVVR